MRVLLGAPAILFVHLTINEYSKNTPVWFLFSFTFCLTFLTHSFVNCLGFFSFFFIFVRGEVYCGHFGRGKNVTNISWQVLAMTMIGVVVNRGMSHFLFYLFFVYKTYRLNNSYKLYRLFNPYNAYRLTNL